ncbi:MAG TPA: hypothetical protein VNZ26_24335 [Vicinamibacterales bacterium]|jgi:hypothetical protein|nr:hypothetical protein [Vicinamibacterales bacterium]
MVMPMHVKASRPRPIKPMKKRMKVKGPRPAQGTDRAEPRPAVLRQIPLDVVDWSLAIRPISVEHVERLGAVALLPPVKVWEFQAGQYRGIDGFHRWKLAKDRGEKSIGAIIRRFPKGAEGEKAFDFECIQSNLAHGLPLKREERDRAIVRVWTRWGQQGERSSGETLDSLGKLFNLTKQRIHQILVANLDGAGAQALGPAEANGELEVRRKSRVSVPGRFSNFGRFSAAVRRVTRLLGDNDFVGALFRERQPDAVRELHRLRALLDELIEAT